MVRVNFENTLNDLVQYQERMRNVANTPMALHLHLRGGNCITMGKVVRVKVKRMNDEELCFLEYCNKDEMVRQMYFCIDDVSAIVAVEK